MDQAGTKTRAGAANVKCLLIIAIGNDSQVFANRLLDENRSFDVCFTYYPKEANRDQPLVETLKAGGEYFFEFPGTTALEAFYFLLDGHSFWREYEYVMRMDDDLYLPVESLAAFFTRAAADEADIAQPTLKANGNVSHSQLISQGEKDRHQPWS
jgi:hypothetical protein